MQIVAMAVAVAIVKWMETRVPKILKRIENRWARILAGVVTIGVATTASAQLQSLPVANHDFESPVQLAAGFTQAVPPGWTAFSGNASSTGVFYPTIGSWGYTAPSNNQVLYLNGATVEQQLSEIVTEGDSYLLVVDVIRRPNFFSPGYRIDFLAGTVLLASDLGTILPPLGLSKVSLLSYVAGPGDPAIGQPLRIRLGGPTQTNFDDVRVYLPEPGVATGMVVLLPGVSLLNRRAPLRENPRERRERDQGRQRA